MSASAPRILQSADEAPCGSLIVPLSDLANVILRWPSGEGFIMVEATHRAWCPSDGWEWSACEDHDFPAHLIAEGLTEAECRHLSGLSATDALAWCEARDKAATAKRPQPGDVVPWAEVEDGCLYHGGGQFRMVVGGQTGGMFGPDDADIGDMLSGKYPGTHAEEVATWYGIDNHAALVARDLGTDPEAWRKAMREWIPPLIVEAHRLITTTATPTKDVAALVGLTPRSLEKRLRRIYGTTARGLRTGAPLTPGRPPSLREEWRVRLTAEERARVDAAIVVGYAAGARSEGEALAAALRRVEEADPARAQASAEATLGRELAALRQKISAERTKWGEERAALEQKIAKQQATIGRLKAEAPANTKPGTVAAKPSIGPKPAPVAAKPPAAPLAAAHKERDEARNARDSCYARREEAARITQTYVADALDGQRKAKDETLVTIKERDEARAGWAEQTADAARLRIALQEAQRRLVQAHEDIDTLIAKQTATDRELLKVRQDEVQAVEGRIAAVWEIESLRKQWMASDNRARIVGGLLDEMARGYFADRFLDPTLHADAMKAAGREVKP